ncbi:acyl-CoA thioesterase [Enterococcus sp. HY326]|uniref:acyl-CoA thioesterase n=1 Tax=Enterococcus sp. HY326 TaxID=2971265 RepID=UPI0022409C0E|nr:acyl-CoA thioesterase [Enterococcus sp. HY326]
MILTCQQTKATQAHLITYPYLNEHKTLFGGQLMSWLDESGGISAVRLARRPLVTASLDHLDFLHSLAHSEMVCIESYVSGAGKRSLEVFCKAIGENLLTGERYLANTCFMTFVVLDKEIVLPQIQPETQEEIFICGGYDARRQKRKADLAGNLELAKHMQLDGLISKD